MDCGQTVNYKWRQNLSFMILHFYFPLLIICFVAGVSSNEDDYSDEYFDEDYPLDLNSTTNGMYTTNWLI